MDNVGCVVVCCDTMWCTICEALAVSESMLWGNGVVNVRMEEGGARARQEVRGWEVWGGKANQMSTQREMVEMP